MKRITKEKTTINFLRIEDIIDQCIKQKFSIIHLKRIDQINLKDTNSKEQDRLDKFAVYELTCKKEDIISSDSHEIDEISKKYGPIELVDFYKPHQISGVVKTLALRQVINAREILCKQCNRAAYAIFAK